MIVKKNKGFTLVELMITVLIVSILAAIGYPMYTGQVKKTRRADAQGQMHAFASAMEQYRSQHFSYEGATIALVMPSLAAMDSYVFVMPAPVPPLDNTYTLTATPVAGTVLDGDGVLIINNQGQTCWVEGAAVCDPTDPTQAWGH